MKRLMISGTRSGCGKTTITCAVLAALKTRGINPTAFKSGPDYIDPMFHRAVSGIPAYNLDPFFLDGDGLRAQLCRARPQSSAPFSLIEGAMGYYDGIAATDEASAYTVARETRTPVVLVVGARGAGRSLGAVLEGFTRHKPDNCIKGVIFNDADDGRRSDLTRIAEEAGVNFCGTMPRGEAWSLPSRRLGLMAAGEIDDLQNKFSMLGRQAERSLDIGGLIALAETAPDIHPILTPGQAVSPAASLGMSASPAASLGISASPAASPGLSASPRVGVARDEAFCFMYEENLEILRALGCTPVFFSPLTDNALPDDLQGLYLCGGYPELHAKTLAGNQSMRESVKRAVENGLPAIAECGGFLYLHETMGGLPLCGVIPGAAFETDRLRRFGYFTLTANRKNLLCDAGGSIRSHEFHYWDSDRPGDGFTARKAGRGTSHPCVHATETLYAGFPHLYFPANPAFAVNFVNKMKFEFTLKKG